MADLDNPTPRALRPPRPIAEVHSDALRLAGLLHLLRHYDAMDTRDRGAVDAGITTAAELAETHADDLEAMLR
jgi:F0F1-type ATP synthase delta subunit